MSQVLESYAAWLADFYLLTAVLLGLAIAGCAVLKQPAQRLAVGKSALVGLMLLGVLSAIPGWSAIHLLTAEKPSAPLPVVEGSPPVVRPSVPRVEVRPPRTAADPANIASTPEMLPDEKPSRPIQWRMVLCVLHLCGASAVFGWLLLGWLASRGLRRSARPAPPWLPELLVEVSSLHGQLACGEVCTSERIDVAVALGVWRPMILLPERWCDEPSPNPVRQSSPQASLQGRGDAADLRGVLAHEAAHVVNGDLQWVALMRVLFVGLWAHPLFWLMRRRLRLDQEALADAAAGEVAGRQAYAEQLVAWARDASRRPAMQLSSAVGLWEGPSQLRQRIAILLNEQLTVVRECTRNWRLASASGCALLAVALSLVTLRPSQSAPADQKARTTSAKQSVGLETSVGEVEDHVTIADRFMVCRVTTELQRSLLGGVGHPDREATYCVFVNYNTFENDTANEGFAHFALLQKRLTDIAKADNTKIIFDLLIGSENQQERLQAMKKLCENTGTAAGFKRSTWSETHFGVFDWTSFVGKAEATANLSNDKEESSVGDKTVKVFPVRTVLSRILANADCVVNIVPVVRDKDGSRFPEGFLAKMKTFVPKLKYNENETMLVRVRYDKSATARVEKWGHDVAARTSFAQQFGFANGQIQQSAVSEDDKTTKSETRKSRERAKNKESARKQPVQIPVIVAKHVLLLEGTEIITWDELEAKIAALGFPSVAFPEFYVTNGTIESGVKKDAYSRMDELHRKYKLQGHSLGTLSARTSMRYDAIRDKADLTPDESLRVVGTVVDAQQKPVAGAEVVLITPVPESLPYKTYDITLVKGRLRKRLDDVVIDTGAAGRFAVYPPEGSKYYVLALHPTAGINFVRGDSLAKDPNVHLLAWAQLTAELDPEPGTTQTASISTQVRADDGYPEVSLAQYWQDLKDKKPTNVFTFTHVPPIMQTSIERSLAEPDGGMMSLNSASVSLLPGDSRRINLGTMTDKEREHLKMIRGLLEEQRKPKGEKSAGAAAGKESGSGKKN